MAKSLWIPLGVVLVLPVAALALSTLSPPACHLQVIPDYVSPIGFKAVLQLSPACLPETVLRVRKSSTLNTVRHGARWQPIEPLTGAWEVGYHPAHPVPDSELHTTTVPKAWRWEWFDPYKKVWTAAEVLHAAP